MRKIPSNKYHNMPCSYVGTGCAFEDITGIEFTAPLPEGLQNDGWLSLDNENKYVRSLLPVRKKQYFKRGERPTLKTFLETNEEKCCVCVYGHFIYVDKKDYYSFFNNDNDEIVCIWFLKK